MQFSRLGKETKPAFLPRHENCTFPSATLISLSVAVLCHGTSTALFLDTKQRKLRLTCNRPQCALKEPIEHSRYYGISSPHGLRQQGSGHESFIDLILVATGLVLQITKRPQSYSSPARQFIRPFTRRLVLALSSSRVSAKLQPLRTLPNYRPIARPQVPRTCRASLRLSGIINPKQHRTGRTAHDHQRQHYRRPPP